MPNIYTKSIEQEFQRQILEKEKLSLFQHHKSQGWDFSKIKLFQSISIVKTLNWPGEVNCREIYPFRLRLKKVSVWQSFDSPSSIIVV